MSSTSLYSTEHRIADTNVKARRRASRLGVRRLSKSEEGTPSLDNKLDPDIESWAMASMQLSAIPSE